MFLSLFLSLHFIVFSSFPCDFFPPSIDCLGVCWYNFYLFASFQKFFVNVFRFHFIVLREHTSYYFSPFKSVGVYLWPAIGLSWRMAHVHWRRMCIAFVGWRVLQVSVRSKCFTELFKSSLSLLIICLFFPLMKVGC